MKGTPTGDSGCSVTGDEKHCTTTRLGDNRYQVKCAFDRHTLAPAEGQTPAWALQWMEAAVIALITATIAVTHFTLRP